jgi:hypothetical protein
MYKLYTLSIPVYVLSYTESLYNMFRKVIVQIKKNKEVRRVSGTQHQAINATHSF